ncbi:bifunctional diaminohydroxyphosphoribosylaminopyrimidine deaminase/5-amino-6-(5-phosphoribosylamino)uracil reductase RibD [Marinihelvus fidelis]|uniref:Riboflavin biosynthesis protein RibD n=2 Tax=Marinihelvus fidelis TaxID=2613842 RepID=A0A5N0TCN9_9GAMM|nr:bifunctional diaminohydroxyphosphoribosylaminopyrimidine deaminase/5-amino-6-(5-phosphoribosylamino)uracil reductase RibD [Marinihelvus fidelis]
MARAIELAERGMNTTAPNPRVGCVLARDGDIIAEGWHEQAGGPHAEVMALAALEDPQAARGAIAYVTLEPCSHHGRTPPCADALVAAGVAEVVIAATDPNPSVNGAGVERLRAAGIACRTGLLGEQAEALNPGFILRMREGRPFVRVKLAQSLDGRIALGNGASQWITGPEARADVQAWRARASAILTGIGTVAMDDPSLNVRLEGHEGQPLRVIVDSRWRTPAAARTLALPGEVLVAGCADEPVPDLLAVSPATLLPLPAAPGTAAGTAPVRVDLHALMAALAARECNEVHVEAGGQLCGALLAAGLVDELMVYIAPCLLGSDGLPSFVLAPLEDMAARPGFDWIDRQMFGDDLRIRLRPQYRDS